MNQEDANRTLALAGIFQAAELVKQLTTTGTADKTAYETSLHSIFKIDAQDVLSVFGAVSGLNMGLNMLLRYGQKNPPFNDTPLFRHVLGMMELARKVLQNKPLFEQLQRRLVPIVSLSRHFPVDDPSVIGPIAQLYCTVFLENQLRIPVMGHAEVLKNPAVIERIRAVLFAGIRAAVLWYQVGGNRFQLLFSRPKLYEYASEFQRARQ